MTTAGAFDPWTATESRARAVGRWELFQWSSVQELKRLERMGEERTGPDVMRAAYVCMAARLAPPEWLSVEFQARQRMGLRTAEGYHAAKSFGKPWGEGNFKDPQVEWNRRSRMEVVYGFFVMAQQLHPDAKKGWLWDHFRPATGRTSTEPLDPRLLARAQCVGVGYRQARELFKEAEAYHGDIEGGPHWRTKRAPRWR